MAGNTAPPANDYAPSPGQEPLPPNGPPAAVPAAPHLEGDSPAARGDTGQTSPGAAGTAATPAPGEAPPPPDVQGVVDDVNGLRSDLENFKWQWQHEIDIHTATTTRALLINGTIQARFSWTPDQATQNAIVYKRKTSFDVPLAILAFTGNLYKDYEEGRNLTYSLRFGVSQQTNTNNSFLNLLDANITYSFLPTVNAEEPALTLTIGQQLLPFGIEVTAPEELKPVINNAQFTTRLNLARRDIGAIVKGDLITNVDYGYNYREAALSYALGVLNGSGPNTLDDNDNKDLLGRLAFTVPAHNYNSWLRQLTLGGTVLIGKQNVYSTDSAHTLQGKGVKDRFGIDVYYNHWPFGLTYEYVRGIDAALTAASSANPQAPVRTRLTSASHTATFFLSFGEQFEAGYRNQGKADDWWPKTYQPFVRVDSFDPDVNSNSNRIDTYTLGLNVFFAETTKFQLNYNHIINHAYAVDPQQPDPRVQANHRYQNQLLAQVQYGF